eukprot:TRINITY_DN4477_c1_g2_i2.p1 TRINITY_DN4477_c1_g2~~TRINITY_DN4477_c1_g2_i2.p1  ORF type:complete len:568 (-),score=99.97 TRINITY_DN4477_c1_g2_i2:76-1779(-)
MSLDALALAAVNASCAWLPRAAVADCCDTELHGPRGNVRCFPASRPRDPGAASFEVCCRRAWIEARRARAAPRRLQECFSQFWVNQSSPFLLELSGAPVDVASGSSQADVPWRSTSTAALTARTRVAQWRRGQRIAASRQPWRRTFAAAEAAYRRCRALGAAYFRVALRRAGSEEAYAFGLCVPEACRRADAVRALALHVVAARQNIPLVDAARWARVVVREAAFWSDLHLDWVIGGFMKCGTTTLAAGLGLSGHPQLLAPAVEGFGELEPEFRAWRIVVERRWVRAFNRRRDELAEKHAAREPGKVLFGIKNPWYIWSDFLLYAFSRIPHLRLLLVVRDPLDAIQSAYFQHAAVAPPDRRPPFRACAGERSTASVSRGPKQRAMEAAYGAGVECLSIEDSHGRIISGWLGAYRMASAAMHAGAYFGSRRLRLVHAETLRQAPRQTLTRLARWLGADADFPVASQLAGHRNRFAGRREAQRQQSVAATTTRSSPVPVSTDAAAEAARAVRRWRREERLCAPRNAGVRRSLLRRFAAEYRGLAALLRASGEPIPRTLLRIKARCPAAA